MGHISLPIPVYNVTFFDQMLRLLRATCVYCFYLRMSKAEVDRYACKLRLIQYGLLQEASALDNMHMKEMKKRNGGREECSGDDIDSDDDDDLENFIARRRKFVDKEISRKGKQADVCNATKINAIADARRQVVKNFMDTVAGVKKCNRCQV